MVDGVEVERWPLLACPVSAWKSGRTDLALAAVVSNPVTNVRFSRLVKSFQPDVVNVHFPEARLACALRIREPRPFRLVVSLHGDEVERWFKQVIRSETRRELDVTRRFLRAADIVTACSQYLLSRAAELEPSISGKARVIHNGIDPLRFADREPYPHGRSYLLAYGRQTYKKGFDLLLRAFALVAKQAPQLDLLLAGDGEERQPLTDLRDSLGLESRVILFGRATPHEVVRLLNGCRLAVIPSREEPFGIVALEALASGRSLVATRVGGLPEVVAAATASGVAPRVEWAAPEPQYLVNALLQALAHPADRRSGPMLSPGFTLSDVTRRYIAALSGTAAPQAAEVVEQVLAAC
jgi:glycosyltransferase involved in cell wall biosynthesis